MIELLVSVIQNVYFFVVVVQCLHISSAYGNTFLRKLGSVTSESSKLKEAVCCLLKIFRETLVTAFSGR